MFTETLITVRARPRIELFVSQTPGPDDCALLVIHGGPDWDHTYLRDPLAALAGRHRVIMADIRGCGRSTSGLPAGEYTPDAVVADFAALLDVLGLARADVLGFSYGGLLAHRFALTHPDRVRRLVIASSSLQPVPPDAFGDWPERAARRAAESAVWADATLSGPELTRAAAIASAPANVWRADRLPGYLERLARVRFTAEWLGPYLAGTLPSPRLPDAGERLGSLRIPVLLLHGERDMTFPAGLARAAGDAIPEARAVVLADAGHMAHVDEPDLWLAALGEFLTG